jgi:hypothetical protein
MAGISKWAKKLALPSLGCFDVGGLVGYLGVISERYPGAKKA